ncbi:protein broad-minded isoform X1 [Hippocampus comes]|uniref:protein broad-minded isoform X1 n=1 Tax=Hippocampus comes TaxID=109280 RepID=UPI00094E3688|nr:PREDICTED: protein broad-minded isoform X1 [Hippocampus comes]XP_019738254.1 PREDICTED: protein broad-minded isoform X1 [Hippocampus comes]XP_019738255.1 PREDICTED: protein broad-minded isoform X1 [Hippocampus comes]
MSSEDEEQLASLLKQFLRSIDERLSGAPTPQSAEEVLLHLEETDKNFHNYEFVQHLRQRVETSLGCVVDKELGKLSREDGQHTVDSCHDALIHTATGRSQASAQYQEMTQTLRATVTAAAERLLSSFDDDQLRKEEEMQHGRYADDCSDSGDSFNQCYTFIRQEQLQALAEKLDPSQPKEVRREALQALRHAPASDVLSCEGWARLRQNLCATLTEPDAELSDHVLRFFAKSFSSLPLNVTREIYSSLARSVQSNFLSLKLSFPSGAAVLDINRPEISSLLKQMRLMNDFQKEATTFWIRHPEKYMEEIIESTFSLLSVHGDSSPEKVLGPTDLLALLDVQAAWFTKWMHGSYSRTLVLRLLQSKYKNLMEAAVQQCILYLECCQHCTQIHSEEPHSSGSPIGSVYSGKELQYAVVVHSLCVLGKVLLYANGRKLFPIKAAARKDPVTLTDLVVILINIMYQHHQPLCSDSSHAEALCPSSLVIATLSAMCERTECADQCLHQAPVVQTLMVPVIQALNGGQTKLKCPAATLPLIADVLARMVNTDRGLALFLYDRNLLMGPNERSTAAHVLLRFTLSLLEREFSASSEGEILSLRAVCGAFISVCGQMYKTCEGLRVLEAYSLHKAAVAAWRKTSSLSERISTPVPENNLATSTQKLRHLQMWEETLLDSLLNFAATPKGVLLLHQTGAMQECVSHMFSRFNKKLQVSRREKFGYGVMVTQVAATGAGAMALQRSGYVGALVLELWSALECGNEDVRVVRPEPTSMEPIDRSCLKSFLSLVNLLSSSQSVWQLLFGQPLANKSEYTLREVPSSVPDLIDRLIAVNSTAKIRSLFHYEQSHTFGLRLLNVLCSSLDSFLLLESQYNICAVLLQSQRDNAADRNGGDGSFILDNASLERNHTLVRVAVVGGPSERRLPPRALQEGDDPYPWPMFWSFPPPTCYSLDPPKTQQNPLEPELRDFLTSPRNATTEDSWMETCRRLYRKVMTAGHHGLTATVLADLLEKVVYHLSKCSVERFFSPPEHNKAQEASADAVALSPVEMLGMDVCLRYGVALKLLRQEDAASHLTLLMKHVKNFLSRRRLPMSSPLLAGQEDYPGHDWLTSTVFLMMSGDWRRSLRLLRHLSSVLTSAFIWPANVHASVDLAVRVAESGMSPLYWSSAHYVEMLLKDELPQAHAAFRMSGFTPSQICIHWLTQCFWNFLDWPEICHYVCICALMGADYQVYACLAVLKHLQPLLLQQTQARRLQVFLKEEPIQGFRFCDYLDFMQLLERRYRNLVLSDMKSICNRDL